MAEEGNSGAPTMPAPVIGATVTGAALPASVAPAMPTMASVHGLPPGSGPLDAVAFDRYRIGTEIARGGMGRVVEAMDSVLGRTVAVKLVLSGDQDTLRRFARETRITARLEHPAIVPVHDAGGVDGNGVPFYVMRRISGRPLEQLVATAENLNARLVLVPHLVASAQAIAHAHERGIVHRDIKPSNILVGELGETIVIDWGLAKELAEPDDPPSPHLGPEQIVLDDSDTIKTRAGIVYGTPGFMAPEQLRGKPVDERCDVYALGATLYHLLCRKAPHYQRDGAAMMRAAASRPPTPISEMVAGVPAELATIVDTALAFDRTARYANARLLADDLQRFLDGQLVAAHYYTRRERFGRWLHRHRIAVTVAVAALLTIAAVSGLAVSRVIDERDRADAESRIAIRERREADAQRASAESRADALTLAQARMEVATDPARALARAAPLVGTHWREVRSIAAAARASGLPWGYPASATTLYLTLLRDGASALSVGTDGVVRRYDLAARTTRVLGTLAGTTATTGIAITADERRLVTWHGATLAVVDLGTLAAAPVTLSSAVRDLTLVGTTAYWVDDAHSLWHLELAQAQPIEIPLAEPATALAASPDGTWLALAGMTAIYALHLETAATIPAGAPTPVLVTAGHATDFDWSSDGDRLAALLGDDEDSVLIGFTADDSDGMETPVVLERKRVGPRQRITAAPRSGMLAAGPSGVAFITRDRATERAGLGGDAIALAESIDETMVAASATLVQVLAPDGERALGPAAGRFQQVTASVHSPYVVAASAGHVLAWNLADTRPRRLTDRAPVTARFAGPSHVVYATLDDEAPLQWLDLQSGHAQALGVWGALVDVAAAPDGNSVAVVGGSEGAHQVHVGRAGAAPIDLDGTADRVVFASATELLLATTGTPATPGHLDLYDLRTRVRRPLVQHAGRLLALVATHTAPAWAAVSFDDRALIRIDLAGGATTSTTTAVASPALVVIADGTVMIGDGPLLRGWAPTSAAPTTIGTLPRPIAGLGTTSPLSGAPIIAVLDDGATYTVQIGAPGQPATWAAAVPMASLRVSLAADVGIAVEETRSELEVVDALAAHRWTLAGSPEVLAGTVTQRARAYRDAQISSDGTRVIATSIDSLLAWDLPLPADAVATAAWLPQLTNATLDPGAPATLGWRAP